MKNRFSPKYRTRGLNFQTEVKRTLDKIFTRTEYLSQVWRDPFSFIGESTQIIIIIITKKNIRTFIIHIT